MFALKTIRTGRNRDSDRQISRSKALFPAANSSVQLSRDNTLRAALVNGSTPARAISHNVRRSPRKRREALQQSNPHGTLNTGKSSATAIDDEAVPFPAVRLGGRACASRDLQIFAADNQSCSLQQRPPHTRSWCTAPSVRRKKTCSEIEQVFCTYL